MVSNNRKDEHVESPIRDWESAKEAYRNFVREREWEPFHNPKDLALGLSIEASELVELTLWKRPDEVAREFQESEEFRQAFLHEASDVLFYVIRLFDVLGQEPWPSLEEKMRLNRAKYPADRVRGSNKKYTAYERPETNLAEEE